METLQVNREKLYTQTEYAKLVGLSKARINQMVKAKVLQTVKIKGATLILID